MKRKEPRSASDSDHQFVTPNSLERNPHPVLHQLRDSTPVAWVPSLSCWLVTRRDLAVAVMRDSATFTVDHPGFSTAQVVGPSMLSLDGEAHRRHRRPFDPPYRRREIEKHFDAAVREQARILLQTIADRGQGDLMAEFAGPLAVKPMMLALGIEGLSEDRVLAWYRSIVDGVNRVTGGAEVGTEGREAFRSLRSELLQRIEEDADRSHLAAVKEIDPDFDVDEIVSNAAVLLFGGIETTEGMIGNLFYHLLTHPQWIEPLKRGQIAIDAFVDESLRLEPAAAVVDRYAVSDVEIGGATIRTGDLVRVSLTAANRDPATFPNPDRLDPTRSNLNEHITFAQGPHVCLGLHLARLEGRISLDAILNHVDGLRLLASDDARDAAVPRGLVFRKPAALRVEWV